jgi:hypothetical protein
VLGIKALRWAQRVVVIRNAVSIPLDLLPLLRM